MLDYTEYCNIPASNLNSCKQGKDNGQHVNNPHHKLLVENGWHYSHTTLCGYYVVDKATGKGEQKYFAHLTYKLTTFGINAAGLECPRIVDWGIGIDCRPGFKLNSSRGGSGSEYVSFGSGLQQYLKRLTRKLRQESEAYFATVRAK